MKKLKLFFLRNKDRLFRFLMVFMSCFVLSFSAFSLSAFAVPSNEVYYLPCSQPQVSSNSCYLEVVCENERLLIYCFAFGLTRADSVSPVFKASVKDGNLIIYVQPSLMSLEDPNLTYPVCVTGFVSYIDYQEIPQNRLGTYTDSSVQSNGYYAGCTLHYSGNVSKVHGYNCDTTDLSRNGDFSYVYGSDTVLNQKIDIINNTLSSIEFNTDLTVHKINDLISQVMQTNANLVQIQSIIQNEGVLTREKLDKIINYLEAAENGAYYNPADDGTSSTVNNQQEKDDEVMQGTSTGRIEANNTISGLSGLLTTTGAVFKGSTAMTKVFNLFAQSSFLVPILQISLVLGISSFVLGTAFIVVGRIRNKKE